MATDFLLEIQWEKNIFNMTVQKFGLIKKLVLFSAIIKSNERIHKRNDKKWVKTFMMLH